MEDGAVLEVTCNATGGNQNIERLTYTINGQQQAINGKRVSNKASGSYLHLVYSSGGLNLQSRWIFAEPTHQYYHDHYYWQSRHRSNTPQLYHHETWSVLQLIHMSKGCLFCFLCVVFCSYFVDRERNEIVVRCLSGDTEIQALFEYTIEGRVGVITGV